jgi:outer membrane lipoprotein-sorting protein
MVRRLTIGCLALAIPVLAQESGKSLTAEQILEKYANAVGGKAAIEKMTSYTSSGTIELSTMGITAATETYAKAPGKRLSVTTIDGYGEIRQGYDGTKAWSKDPQGGLKEITGDEAIQLRIDSTFDAPLRWKSLYSNVELVGKDKASGKDCYMLKLTPEGGKPVQRCYDAETFLVSRGVNHGAGGEEVPVELSDYKDVGTGLKMPMTIRVTTAATGELIIRYKEVKPNVEIEDAKFSMPTE